MIVDPYGISQITHFGGCVLTCVVIHNRINAKHRFGAVAFILDAIIIFYCIAFAIKRKIKCVGIR